VAKIYIDLGEPYSFEIDGHLLEIYWTEEDNHYVYARLVQPDGTEWHGFSGYGVGAGLEEAGYGTEPRNVKKCCSGCLRSHRPAINNMVKQKTAGMTVSRGFLCQQATICYG